MTNKLKFMLSTLILTLVVATAINVASGKPPASPQLDLTPLEMGWLSNHKVVRVGMSPVFPPLKFTENGEIKGIEPDYLKLLSELTGIQFELVRADFQAMDAMVKSGELDMFITFNIPERLAYMTFTENLFEFKNVVVTRNDSPFISGIAMLRGKKVATVKGVKLYDKILAPYPDITRVPVDTMGQMFRAVSEAQADALISKTFYAGYIISNYPNLKIAGIADLPPEPYMYAVRKDFPELVSILNKAIRAIPQERREAIVQKWFNVRVEYTPNWHDSLRWLVPVAGTFILVLGMTLFWNRRLQREIKLRSMAEQTALQREEQLKTIFEASDAGIILVSPAGGIDFANRRMSDMLGTPLNELLGSPYPTHLHPSEKQIGDTLMRQLIVGEIQSVSHDRHYIRKDGTDFWGHLSGRRLENPDGSLRALVGVITDITERREFEQERLNMEQQLFDAQKLESLGVLAGGIAHDFNNILTAIVGNADLALMRINKESPATDNLRKIETAAARAADLARQMLAYSGKGQFVIEQIKLNILIQEMINLLEASISKKATLRFNLSQSLPPIDGDITQIRQIIMNLVINASEALGDNSGVIAITTSCLECDPADQKNLWLRENIHEGQYVCLEIADNGCGMDTTTQSKLFDPFFTTKFTGRGLGMASVLGIVRGHKGTISVESEPDKGTTFRILLPVSVAPAATISGDTDTDNNWHDSGTVLLVDDEEAVLDIGSEMLKELGFSVITARNGMEAIEIIRIHDKIRFVILDLTMPEMDGEQCLRELRQLKPNMNVLMSSGYSEHEVVGMLHEKGAAGFIQKPYTLASLRKTIAEVTCSNS